MYIHEKQREGRGEAKVCVLELFLLSFWACIMYMLLYLLRTISAAYVLIQMMKKNEVKIKNAAIFHILIWEDIQSNRLIVQLENHVTVKGSKTEVSGPTLVALKRRIFIVFYLMWHGTLVLQFHLKDQAIYNDGLFLGDDLKNRWRCGTHAITAQWPWLVEFRSKFAALRRQ